MSSIAPTPSSSAILPVTVAVSRAGGVPSFGFFGKDVDAVTGEINLEKQADYVLILFQILSADGDRFAADRPIDAAKGSCPPQPGLHGPFKDCALDATQTMLAVGDDNGGLHRGHHQYALHFVDSSGNRFSKDPVIVNK
jgi:hypothetical protein